MNIAMILAGGVDPRFQMNVPKQFVNVFNRPVISYTLETFQNHIEIDTIVVVCLDGWQEMVRAYAKQFNINKLELVVTGGSSGQDSSYNGVVALNKICKDDDIVIIHDSIRPLVSEELISDSIRVCRKNNMGIAAICSMDTVMKSKDGRVGDESISRYEIMRVQTPQSYRFHLLRDVHEKAKKLNVSGHFDTNSMMSELGEKIFFSKGSDFNLKINTIEDVEMFRALYRMQHEEKLSSYH